MARVDTNRWLEVTGVVGGGDHLATIEADSLASVERPEPAADRRPPPRPEQGLPAEVIFSAPTQDDTGVPLDAPVRLQFSRDMNADSFAGNVGGRLPRRGRRRGTGAHDGVPPPQPGS